MKPIAIAVGDMNNDMRPDLVVSNYDANDISVLLNDGFGNFTVTNYGAGVGPGEIALADINDDSKLDVAVINQIGGAIVIFPNDGAGGLLPLNFIALPPSSNPIDIVSADFNHDNKADFATANTANSFSVVLRNGPNTFNSPTTNTSNFLGDLKAIAVGDFTGDNELDLVVVSYGESAVRVLKGNGTGAFTFNPPFATLITPGGGINVYLSDINFDGKLDIVTSIYRNSLTNSMIRVFYGNGVGGVSQTSDVLLGASARSIAITDLNGDSKLDVVTNFASLIKSGLAVSLNDGTGQLETATFVGAAGNQTGTSVISDFNLDGRPDLAFITGSGGVQVRLGLANGDLATATNYGASSAHHLAVGDFNQDGKPDFATANSISSNVSVFLNNGSGGFGAPTVYPVGSFAKSLVVGDFTNDGKLDLVVTANNPGAVRVFTGNGMGNFLLTGTTPLNASPAAIVSGDFNNDGKLDVITANECITGSCTAKLITFFPGNGTGGFGAAVDLSTQDPPSSSGFPGIGANFLAIADFNGDGRLDLTLGRGNPGSYNSPLQVMLNAGGGTFATPISLSASLDNTAVAAGDVNNDGRPDIVAASQYGEIQIFLNSGGTTFEPPVNDTGVGDPSGVTIGDINNDGKRDIIFVQSFGVWRLLNKCALTRGAHTSDFDGDGITDISVFRPSTGIWYLLYSSDGSFHAIPFGAMGDVPVIGDYDGDGLTNFAVWRPTTGYWYTSLNPATNFGAVLWGSSTDRPVQADYDGDGRTDIAVYRPSTAYWYLLRSSLGYQEQQFGIPDDIPVPADFDNDGRANFAVFRDSTGWWYTSLNPATNYGGVQLGQSGDIPVPGFYDSDGRADAAVFRLGDWYIHQSNTGNVAGTHFGSSGDEAAPSAIRHP